MSDYSKIFLASASPRRVELLNQLGVEFEQIPNNFDETQLLGETPSDYVQRLALGKAQTAYQIQISKQAEPMLPVLGADTIVVLNGQCLGKPADKQDALETLRQLSGKTNQVYTAVSLFHSEFQKTVISVSKVKFSYLSEQQIEQYWQTGEPQGKAGSYAIQGVAASLIEYISGSYTGIVGLPLFETRQLLEQHSVKHALSRK